MSAQEYDWQADIEDNRRPITDPPAPVQTDYPEFYRVRLFEEPREIECWLNEQAAHGYELHTISAAANRDYHGVWVVVRRIGGPA